MRYFRLRSALVALTFLSVPVAHAQQAETAASATTTDSAADLGDGFRSPPGSAHPRVWWHWLSGNVSQDGITKDFEWMKRVGIAGAMMFDGNLGGAKIVPHPVTVLSPAWYDNLRFAAGEAERLGLEFTMAAAPGWSETGGPWVKPEQAMKKFVWSETRVSGRQRAGQLAPLPSAVGPFQGIKRPGAKTPAMARDVAVLAFRAPKGEKLLAALNPTISTSVAGVDARRFADGDLNTLTRIPNPTPGQPQWVRYDFAKPQTIRALTYVGMLGGQFAEGPAGRIEASDDGANWRTIRTLVGAVHHPAPQRTLAFPATTARHFRVVFDRGVLSRESYKPSKIELAELALVPGARVDLFEDRAGFGVLAEVDQQPTPEVAPAAAIRASGILDLTDRLRPDGTLDWTAPAGQWIVLRTGWSLTGEINHPATPEGTGLEVDKLNADHVRAHLDGYVTPVIQRLNGLVGERGLRYLLTDSWEAGQENWTEPMPAEFSRRRGYDLMRMLPVLAGYVVDSAEKSDAFLWDFRRTLADLVAENHYGTITRFAKEHKLGYYGEATGTAWPTVADGMLAKSQTDIPMGEFWTFPVGGKPFSYHRVPTDEFPADIIETRSTAHVYGKPLVAAEALTSALPLWISTPWRLKWIADRYMAMGVNRLVIHTSVHQPTDDRRPGLSLGPFGQTFTRHETWGEMAKPWIDYLSRGSYLLQQGAPIADVLYFYGEGAPSGVPYDREGEPADLRQFGFDYVNADALTRLAKVEDGRIAFPGGASYKVLVLPGSTTRMTLPMVTRLRDLVAAGAVLVGPRPMASPSLSSDSAAVRMIADQLWGKADDGTPAPRSFGKGRVYAQADVLQVLAAERVLPDFEARPADPAMDLRFAHRRIADGDIYFVTNQSGVAATVPIRFRVTGKQPERWDATDGSKRALSYRGMGDYTEVPLALGAYESVFVVFRRPATSPALDVASPVEHTVMTLDNGWTLSIPAPSGGAPIRTSAAVGSWTESDRADQRYFSGVATYARELRVGSDPRPKGSRTLLDLGQVGDVAEVYINGTLAGTAWKPPYRVDITDWLVSGRNRIEVKVANTWQNRIVGDLQPNAETRTWTNMGAGSLTASTPLTPSGLIGPVRLIRSDAVEP
ncbi:glycosyl hydrolase [Novosphingobium bradum]|uniref:Glycosyl hydrolase n=1 Tax=Novosphingobium bradum TaxID=1737444 RepID=A0ABV7IRY0_9SPHN